MKIICAGNDMNTDTTRFPLKQCNLLVNSLMLPCVYNKSFTWKFLCLVIISNYIKDFS